MKKRTRTTPTTKRTDKRQLKDLPTRNDKDVKAGATAGAGAGKATFEPFTIKKTYP
jgi:hypothetical protein